jgi:hypothetical protein
MCRAISLFVIVLAACGGDAGSEIASTDDSSVAISIAPSAEIEVELGPVELPATYPADVPLPPFSLEGAEELQGETSTIYDITGWYDGDPISGARDYLAALEAAGFEVTGRSEAPESLFFTAVSDEWFVSAGFFPDPVREVGTSVGVTVAPADAMSADA